MSETGKCSKCGNDVHPDVLEGECPQCLLEAGLGCTGGSSTTADASVADSSSRSQTPRPEYIGRYLVVEWFDRSGQAEVCRAVHPNLGKELVIKIARAPSERARANPELIAREGRLLAELQHSNLVHVFDLDVHDGRPFLVMEYVRGRTLQKYAEDERPTPLKAAMLVAVLARGLEVAHDQGIVHQDIKPQNILVDELGRLRLIDFGMAWVRHPLSEATDGPIGGTPAYMAPEQARGEPARPGSDVFALGAVLYFLLTGAAPFPGKSWRESLDRARRCDFDAAALEHPSIPRRLRQICLRAMSATLERRHARAAEMAGDLERFARPRRRSLVLASGGVLALLLLVFGIMALRPVTLPPPTAAMRVDIHRRNPPEDLGAVGSTVFAGRYGDDDVRVHARLSAPAYCYLIALNPDGKEQLCLPPDESKVPPRSTELAFPADPTKGFGLTDGVGLQAFVLVVSNDPLPRYRTWRASLGRLPWRPTEAARSWRYDGHEFIPLEAELRGQIRKLTGLPEPFAEVCRTIRARPGIASIQAVAFPVRPKADGAAHTISRQN